MRIGYGRLTSAPVDRVASGVVARELAARFFLGSSVVDPKNHSLLKRAKIGFDAFSGS